MLPAGARAVPTKGSLRAFCPRLSSLLPAVALSQQRRWFRSLPGTALDVREADVPAGRSLGVCPEPARLVSGTVVGTDAEFSPVSTTATSALNAVVLSNPAGTVPGSKVTSLAGESVAEIAKSPTSTPSPTAGPPVLAAGVASISPVTSPTVVGAEPIGNEQASMAANLSYSATDGDLRGLAAAQCQQPGNDAWLLGANTALGRTAVLNLSNASETPATVNLDLFGHQGQIQAPGARGLLIAPGPPVPSTSRASPRVSPSWQYT